MTQLVLLIALISIVLIFVFVILLSIALAVHRGLKMGTAVIEISIFAVLKLKVELSNFRRTGDKPTQKSP